MDPMGSASSRLTQAVVQWFRTRHAAGADPQVFPFDSEWVKARPGQAYLRYGPRVIPVSGNIQVALVLSNLELAERARGKGVFRNDLLPTVMALARSFEQPLLLENVINPRLADFLRQQGHAWVGDPRLPTFMLPPC